jgi:hypothetical protein
MAVTQGSEAVTDVLGRARSGLRYMPPEQGATRYTDWGCRCEVWRPAHADRHRELRWRRRASGPGNDHILKHGPG